MNSVAPEVFGVVYRAYHTKDPRRTRYGGQTVTSLPRRVQGHWHAARGGVDLPMARWLRHHSDDAENIVFEVVSEHYSRPELDQAEVEFIRASREMGMCDLNIAAGGGGTSGVSPSAETIELIRATLRGEGTWKHVLKWSDVHCIRQRSLAGERIRDILRDYPVEESTIGQVIRNTTWYDPEYTPKSVTRYPPRLSRERIAELRAIAKAERHSPDFWADEWGISYQRVIRILRNITCPDPDYDPQGVLPDNVESMSHLTWTEVREIRSHRLQVDETNEVTASRYGVDPGVIKRVLNNYSFVDPSFDPSAVKKPARGSWVSKLTADQARDIRNQRIKGWVRMKDIAEEYGVSISTIRGVLDNKTHFDPRYEKGMQAPRS